MRTEKNWSPERMWTNGMMDTTNRHLLAVADVRNDSVGIQDLDWYGHDPHAPLQFFSVVSKDHRYVKCQQTG